jgi:predicted nucleic acid-binding Zn ribbon protein
MVILIYGKQNYQCLICGTQLVIRDEVVSDQTKELMLAANKADRPAILNASTAH